MKRNLVLVILVSLIMMFSITQSALGCCFRPKVISLSANKGINNEIVEVTITGNKFKRSTSVKLVKFGEVDIIVDNIKFVSKNQIICSLDLRNRPVGDWDFVVTNHAKFLFMKIKKETVISKGFTIEYPAPAILSVSPSQGQGKTRITITGIDFRPGVSIILSNTQTEIRATNVNSISNTQISGEINLDRVPLGIYNIKVVNDDGKSASLVNSFAVIALKNPSPTIRDVNPRKGFNNGSISVTIIGNDFDKNATVKLIGSAITEIMGTNVKVESPTKLTCFFDIRDKMLGSYDVALSNPDGQLATLPGGFVVEAFDKPTISKQQQLKSIFFDYDQSELRSDQLDNMGVNLATLKDNPGLFVILGGHADERGTQEYNLQLTTGRVETIKQYLLDQGISSDRITMYSYGKDYPVKQGHDESYWWYNRRVDILMWETVLNKEQVGTEVH